MLRLGDGINPFAAQPFVSSLLSVGRLRLPVEPRNARMEGPVRGDSHTLVGKPTQEVDRVVCRCVASETVIVRVGSVELKVGDILECKPCVSPGI